MLISKVPDNDEGKRESVAVVEEENDSHEYQTANELFELMAKNQNIETGDVEKLTTGDLVLLYKNIDLGTKLMSNANELKRKPNQRVETIVYNDEDSEGSDISDIYSNEDLHNVVLVNGERIDLLNSTSSGDNKLCHKLGDLKIQSSKLTAEYDKHFLFKDSNIKEQLRSLKIMNNSSELEGTVLPASLLDYICSKRFEDNQNFYMDNIIRHVTHTIEQLKRISNGDYLTAAAKEKWRGVENPAEDHRHTSTKALAISNSIPVHAEQNIGALKSMWDDIVHSAVDIRTLSKILKKKIVVEVPKLLYGPYKLLSNCCAENVVISCVKDKKSAEDSRVDVMVKLQRSETVHVISKINSILILQTAPVECDPIGPELLPLPLSYKEQDNDKGSPPERHAKLVELEVTDPINVNETIHDVTIDSEYIEMSDEHSQEGIEIDDSDNDGNTSFRNSSNQESCGSSDALREMLDRKLEFPQREVTRDVFPEDLRVTIQKLTMPCAVTEESGEDISQSTATKRKSPTRARIKSPYENQSHAMEEKKRKKLLEIRERRERKKMALAENCKITKHKYGKGAIMPQSASSVTKLSISNKSFYNSIYGQTSNTETNKQAKGKNRKEVKREVLEISLGTLDGEHEISVLAQDKNSKKYTNRSYYLDDAVSEMMYMNMKHNDNNVKDVGSASTSVVSNDFRSNLNLLSQLICPSETDLNMGDDEISPDSNIQVLSATRVNEIGETSPKLVSSRSILNVVPLNSPKQKEEQHNTEQKKVTSSVECRKSIDKIYTLIKRIGNTQETESKPTKSKHVTNTVAPLEENEVKTISTCQASDSGTSLKHNLTSSNPSSFSFDKNNTEQTKNIYNRKAGTQLSTVVPKVIISSKPPPALKATLEKNKKDRKRAFTTPTVKIQDNPLKAISQLLHEFEHVQKTRQKPNVEQKSNIEHKLAKKAEMTSSDGKSGLRQSSLQRRSRIDQHNENKTERFIKVLIPKEKKAKQYKEMDVPKIPYQQIPVEEKPVEKTTKRKVTDIIDEAKEARGEAVRGPSKLNSRLNSLAQPKRSYVQAHSEEYQTKYGKNLMADRLQRLAAAPQLPVPERSFGSANSKGKAKRNASEPVSTVSAKLPSSPPVLPLERAIKSRHSSSSPIKERHNQGPFHKQITVPETPQMLKKKMVAVESYVKNHYGLTSASVVNDSQSVEKSRAPLLPNDLDLVSLASSPVPESTELGNRLHNIINSIMKTNSKSLEVLTECHESNSKIIKEYMNDSSVTDTTSPSELVASEYSFDILDKNVGTSVKSTDNTSTRTDQKQTNVIGDMDFTRYQIQPFKSVTELEKLENALCHQISVGTFHKRLRIKNLTLTPKQSMQQVLAVQSGDASSLVVHASIAENLKEIKTDHFSDLNALPVLSKSKFNWNNSQIPMQISTVGYVFPDFKTIQCGTTSLMKLMDNLAKSSDEVKQLSTNDYKTDQDNQCYKGGELRSEEAGLPNVREATTLIDVGIGSSHIIKFDKKVEIKQSVEPKTESKQVFKDFSDNKVREDIANGEQTKIEIEIKKNENACVTDKLSGIEYTTSLDILVGLLNEIQNISTCQTQMTREDRNQFQKQQLDEMETILNKSTALGNSTKSIVSFSSLDKLRQLESTPSHYSFYLSDFEGAEQDSSKLNFPKNGTMNIDTNELLAPNRIYSDKEVGVDLMDKEFVHKLTDVPSQIYPLTVTHSTMMTNSLKGVISQPSIHSLFSIEEYHSFYSHTTGLDHNNNIDIPQIIITTVSDQSLAVYEDNKLKDVESEEKSYEKKAESFDKKRITRKGKINRGKFCLKSDFDPMMKMKRDILVTVYSLLVFTVFAALSLPEMLYRI